MYIYQGCQVAPLDILSAKLIKIIRKRKEIKNNSSNMITKKYFFTYLNHKICIFIPKKASMSPKTH